MNVRKPAFPIQPLGDRMFVKRLEAKKMFGSLHLVADAQEPPQFGKIVAIGPKVDFEGNLSEGMLVLFGKYAGTEIEVLGTKYVQMREEEVQGVVVDQALADTLVTEGV
jgi:chaperonin GroES